MDRTLTDYVNQSIPRIAMDREGLNPRDEEVGNTHWLLTVDEVSKGTRTQAHSWLNRRGVDADAAKGFRVVPDN